MQPACDVILKPRRAQPFFGRHPWVFAGAIQRVVGQPQAGDAVTLRSDHQGFIAHGLFNPESNIRIRLYSWDEEQPINADLLRQRIDAAVRLRERLFDGRPESDGCRVIFSEADGLSGLTVDRYGDWLVMQLTSRALASFTDDIVVILQERLSPKGIWLRTEKGIRQQEGLEQSDGLIVGETPPRPLFIEEQSLEPPALRFGVDITEGQKTGFYFDQRDNRQAVARYTRGARVLDMFCYTGGFALAAARGGASHVLGIDRSESAIELARANAELNELSSKTEFQISDAFKTLERLASEEERFDLVILDPPKMARHRKGLEQALRGYHSLNQLAVRLLSDDGILVTCSCSGLVDRTTFESILARVAIEERRPMQILESRSQAADHPVSPWCLENRYLKCAIARVGERR